ncbi:MAG: hypothetical protein CVV42_13730 [Candidatus Riflebacteria bacterium HGW-Riflebacteria-2]|jgi:tetratricopeptide (TPR) repeat protein/uncharacterized tellurite resistance protein B-like protein|nr:MAG: hypothetical protein CVV42_13730 [Candidatus Riflebacteria bacterium HGW-Riflebacteria-2]
MNSKPAGNDPLSREELFRMFADEACRDGVLENFEKKILLNVARFLRMENEEAGRILQESHIRFEQGLLGESRRFEPRALYLRALQGVYADGQIDELEDQMLAGLRKMFDISPEEHETMLKTFLIDAVPAPETMLPQEQPSPKAASATELPPHQPGSTTGHLAGRLDFDSQKAWFSDHCRWYQAQRQASDLSRQAWERFLNGLQHGSEKEVYDGLDMIDDILNPLNEILLGDVLLALAVMRWSRVLLKTGFANDKDGPARTWPLENIYMRLSIKMGPILISIDHLRVREGIEEAVSMIFVHLLEDLAMLVESRHADPMPHLGSIINMLFRVSPKAGVTHRAADLLKILAAAARRQGGVLAYQFVQVCRNICEVQPRNHPLVIEADQAILSIEPEDRLFPQDYQSPVSRPSASQPYEPALQRLERLISEVSQKQENELMLTAALAKIDLSILDDTRTHAVKSAAENGLDPVAFLERYLIAMILPELPGYQRPVMAFFALGEAAGHHEEMKGGWCRLWLKTTEQKGLQIWPDFPVYPSTELLSLPLPASEVPGLKAALHRSGGAYDVALVDSARNSARIWHQVGDLDPTGNLYLVEHDLLPADNTAEATHCLDEALVTQPWLSAAMLQKGLIAKRAGDRDTARRYFAEALVAQPHDPHALTRMGVLEKNENQLDKADDYLIRSLRILPVQPSALVTFGSDMLSRLASDDSSALPLWDYYIAGLHANQGDRQDFRQIAEVSDRLDPKLARNARVVPVDTVFYI